MPLPDFISPGRLASIACLLEVCAPKPGNVHRGADFDDVGFEDFVVSAEMLGAVIDANLTLPVGEVILRVVKATRAHVGTNTNLGLALMLCPLARCATMGDRMDESAISTVLMQLSQRDSEAFYKAIRIAKPAGMQPVNQLDVDGPAPSDILAAMELASQRDLVARQYRDNFKNVFVDVVPALLTGRLKFNSLREAIVFAHVSLISRFGDSLIARKCGEPTSVQAKRLAGQAIDALEDGPESYFSAVADLDFWLRADGHRRNPGTTADLIAAGLMVAMFNGDLEFSFGTDC